MSKPRKIKVPKAPRSTSPDEMNTIIKQRASGRTHKEIKESVDRRRKEEGCFKGKGISTNTISRILGRTHGVEFKRKNKDVWERYDNRVKQHETWMKIKGSSKDNKRNIAFDKAIKKLIEHPVGQQHVLTLGYNAETDVYEIDSP